MIYSNSPIAIIDIGTNTFNLLVKEVHTGKLLLNTKIPVKLGQGGLREDKIADDAFSRGIQALQSHRETALTYGVKEAYAFATSAVRSTRNGKAFAEKAKEVANITINVIDGLEEAEFIVKGVNQAIPLAHETALIMDIGGGSTEFIITKNGQTEWMESYLLGASRIIELLQVVDPLSPTDLLRLHQLFTQELITLRSHLDKSPIKTLIGSSGSFDTMYDLIAHETNKPLLGTQKAADFSIEALLGMTKKLKVLPLTERLALPGMLPMRADMMPISAVFIDYILSIHPFETVKLSTYSLKEGVFETLLNEDHTWQVSLL
jgi:exopolyphosphatase/guanosine-5'-triphosphate,3'-diphosphate pyrophosphatase